MYNYQNEYDNNKKNKNVSNKNDSLLPIRYI
jgi:hypothetical protein